MKNKFTIIISDINGSKHYTISQIVKKIVAYLLLFFVLISIFVTLWIKFLLKETRSIESAKESYQKQALSLESQNRQLQDKIDSFKKEILSLQKAIKLKSKRLNEINDKISDLENSMGIKNDGNETIYSRIEILKINTIVKKVMIRCIPNGFPVKYMGITSKFGWRKNPIKKNREFHPGLDLRAKRGEKVYATADGIVEYSGFHKTSGYGNLIILDHNYGFKTLYAHLSKREVKNGQFVKKGDLIGYVGNTGLSTGAHLHYGVMYLQKFLDPYYMSKWSESNFEYIFQKERRVQWQSLIKAIRSQIRLLSPKEQ